MRCIVLILALLISACANFSHQVKPFNLNDIPSPPISSQLFIDSSNVVVEIDDVFRLTKAQQEDFFKYYNRPKNRNLYPNKRIYQYLTEKMKGFNFYSDTLTANEAISQKLGNCLSLAIVTHSLATLVGVEVQYELVETPPIYQREGEFVLSSQHVQTLLFEPEPGDFYGQAPLWRGFIRVDYYPAQGTETLRKVSTKEFYAMFYRNKAAEAMTKADYEVAFQYLRKALELIKNDNQAINMMAIIHERKGHSEKAEELYLYALEYGRKDEQFELLFNYHLFLESQGRHSEALEIQRKIAYQQNKNPYKWVNLGDSAFAHKDYSSALGFYRKALKLADYLHEPYAGIAKAQYQLGNVKGALRNFKKAIDKSHDDSIKKLYFLKYNLLKKRVSS
ncbi:tetratricopeptide repeat protein [Aliikangiella sp. G2MR2-5]|uniref:tetratricopeptide repeat protein n=1 Tax=Aliikangiella sp. G2MR2-5 TaxID=2788943 RepID=UPI0018A8E5D3|nr:tetratricopeptide repeat protein [Aliikangiella sp. G2MR2-5]